MRNTTLKLGATALIIVAGFGVAQAQDRRGDRMPPSFEELDVDGSGEIEASDFEALRDARFAEMDTDGNGQVSQAEFVAAATARAGDRATEAFERLDADGDGILTQDTLQAREGGRRSPTHMLRMADADGSGGISEAEFDAFIEKVGNQRGERGKRG